MADRLGLALSAAREGRARIGVEIREARLAAGISQRTAAGAVGMSHAQFGRIERNELRDLTFEQGAKACAAVGLKLVARAYPLGEPVRDGAHLALLARLRARLPEGVGWRTEVPLGVPGDLRAWDAVLRFPDGLVAVEAETRIRDVQSLERKVSLKQQDGRVETVILLVNDTEANRRTIRVAREALSSRFPFDTREVLRAIRGARAPVASGILFL